MRGEAVASSTGAGFDDAAFDAAAFGDAAFDADAFDGRSHEALDDVLDAVRLLVGVLQRSAARAGPDGVLVDLVVDGARCVVTAGPAPPGPRTPGLGTTEAHPLLEGLSPREQEIARMVASGYTNKEIAAVLEISSWTVSTHLRRIFGKVDVGTRAAMVARLFSDGSRLPRHGAPPPDD